MHGGRGAAFASVRVVLARFGRDKSAVNFALVRGTVMPPRRERQPPGEVRGSPKMCFVDQF